MTASAEPVPSLIGWGASPDADLVYRQLSTFGRATAGELFRELGMPRARVDAALDKLAALGLAVARRPPGRTSMVWAPRSTARVRREPPSPPAAGAWPREALPDVVVHHATHLGEGLRHLPSRAASRARLGELVAVARHEHLAMHPESSFDAEAAKPALAMDRTLLERGVSMRVLGVQPATPDPLSTYGRTPSDPQPAYREMPAVPMKLFVVDRKVALFPVTPTDVNRGYLEVTQPPVVAALVALFERHWAAGRAVQENPMSRLELDPREHTLIGLLAQGHTDASAATELRVSPRTVSTIVRSLMDRLGVENRFQLGLALGARHLVAPPEPDGRRRPA
ncbi:helix-turn-helix transcriptional regulator [Phytohabitans sp. ZYX-F-186]|uniref:Helix-turn-helix transcriptional regulator n=1 Tax=Phytohabitans maris TaxID=3071409 RepID=A0ABU0ZUJ4_9ACTN|nr:helix-turn-helix transcriptional regulator [Phytohabitans sp. ZYX-F-186]MDQ7910709.1 helix-turn-helix transcriptional regulator [Phytohabitans sp. ZYX-F-186]